MGHSLVNGTPLQTAPKSRGECLGSRILDFGSWISDRRAGGPHTVVGVAALE